MRQGSTSTEETVTIAAATNKELVHTGPLVGIEVETEFFDEKTGPSRACNVLSQEQINEALASASISISQAGWKSTRDGSLLSPAMEFVLKNPCKPTAVDDVLTALFKTLDECKYKAFGTKEGTYLLRNRRQDSLRTSVHMHHNVSDMPVTDVVLSYTALLLFENVLVEICGADKRRGNGFCVLTSEDAGDVEHFFRNMTRAGIERARRFTDLSRMLGQNMKYSFTNILPLHEHGTIEMRGMAYTEDVKLLSDWAKGISKAIRGAHKIGNDPASITDNVWNDPVGTAKKLFGATLTKRLLDAVGEDRFRGLVEETVETIGPIFYTADMDRIRAVFSTGAKPAKKKKAPPLPVGDEFIHRVLRENLFDPPLRGVRNDEHIFAGVNANAPMWQLIDDEL